MGKQNLLIPAVRSYIRKAFIMDHLSPGKTSGSGYNSRKAKILREMVLRSGGILYNGDIRPAYFPSETDCVEYTVGQQFPGDLLPAAGKNGGTPAVCHDGVRIGRLPGGTPFGPDGAICGLRSIYNILS